MDRGVLQVIGATDPAAAELQWVIWGLGGLGVAILVGTAVFWKITRPELPAGSDAPAVVPPVSAIEPATSTVTAAAPAALVSPGPVPAAARPAPDVVFEPIALGTGNAVATTDHSTLASIADQDTQSHPFVVTETGHQGAPPADAAPIVAVSPPSPGKTASDPGPDRPKAPHNPLIDALAALPDLDPVVIRFDDPPVQRRDRGTFGEH